MDNEEYTGDAPYFSLFPFFFFYGECMGDEGGHRYGHGMMM